MIMYIYLNNNNNVIINLMDEIMFTIILKVNQNSKGKKQ